MKSVLFYKIKGIKIECSDFTHSIFLKHSLSYKGRVSMRNSLYFTILDGYSLNWWSMITSGGILSLVKFFIYKFNDICYLLSFLRNILIKN